MYALFVLLQHAVEIVFTNENDVPHRSMRNELRIYFRVIDFDVQNDHGVCRIFQDAISKR